MAITTFTHTDAVASNWAIQISDTGIRLKLNPCIYNSRSTLTNCQIKGCTGSFVKRRKSGLCDVHKTHTSDLFLDVLHSGSVVSKPSHVEMIELLLDWAHSRNYRLEPFFESLSFNVLGNIPDVTTLDGMSPLSSRSNINLSIPSLFNSHALKVVDQFFPENNNASYQLLITKAKLEIPARILATVFASLVFCEEANRGDRWFYRTIVGDETKTKILGGAMPLAYFAARRFNWGVEMKSVLPLIFH
jgi:hypothetical protein